MALAPRAPIGQRLKAGRRDKALTQRVLAEEIGISVSYLNLIENNKRVIGGTLLRDLARRLDLDLDTLTCWAGVPARCACAEPAAPSRPTRHRTA